MAIKNGNVADADEVMNAFGSNFNDVAQMIFNSDYLGFDSRLANSGIPNLKNVFYSTFTSDDADEVSLFDYDSTNDLYFVPNLAGVTEFIIIEATSYNSSWTNGTNDTFVIPVDTGKWLIYCDTGTDAVHRAQIHKSLWHGTTGSDQLILDFTSVTSVKTTNSNDVGKQVHSANANNDFTGTFINTTTNTNCSTWSDIDGSNGGSGTHLQWEIPSGVARNSVGSGSTSFEMGTDKTADEVNNPANCQIDEVNISNSGNSAKVIILCEGDITWSGSGSDIDFFTTHSIPLMTASGNFATEIGNDSTLIFKDTVTSTDNVIAVINSQIDATSTQQISISADGGSIFIDVDNAEIARPVAGTELWRKIVITRTDLTKIDKVTEQAVKHNFY